MWEESGSLSIKMLSAAVSHSRAFILLYLIKTEWASAHKNSDSESNSTLQRYDQITNLHPTVKLGNRFVIHVVCHVPVYLFPVIYNDETQAHEYKNLLW